MIARVEDQALTIVVPRWAIEFIIEHAMLCDEGPYEYGQGWPSAKMRQAREAIEASLKAVG
jgi:hypothetical protein